MDIKDFQRIAKAVGMKPTDRDDMAEIASPDGEDAYVLRLGAVTDGPDEVDAIWLSLQRGLRREDGREWLTPRTGRVSAVPRLGRGGRLAGARGGRRRRRPAPWARG